MKKFFVGLLTMVFVTGAGNIFAAPSKDQTLAIVNGEPILASEFNNYFNVVIAQLKSIMPMDQIPEQKMGEVKNTFLNKKIEEVLLRQEAKKQKITVSKKEVLDSINEMKKQGGESAFNAEIQKQNFTPASFEKYMGEQLVIMKLLTQNIPSLTRPATDNEIKDIYDKVIIKMKGGNTTLPPDADIFIERAVIEVKKIFGEKARIKQIFIKNPKGATAAEAKAAADKVETVKKELQKKPFADIAKQYSEDIVSKSKNGDVGTVAKGDLPPELDKIIFAMKAGDYTKEPIKTDKGCYFIKVEEKTASKEITLDKDLKDLLRTVTLQVNIIKGYINFLNTLRAKANIKINKIW